MQGCARVPRGTRWSAALLAALATSVGQCAPLQGSVGASSNNVFRGLSLSTDQPSLLADLHAAGTRWFGGLAADTVRLAPHDSTAAQLIGYLGYQQVLGENLRGTLSLHHYDYLGEPERSRYDYDELSATLGWQDRLFVALTGSPDTYKADAAHRYGRGAALAAELSGRIPLAYGLAVQLGLGYYDLQPEIGAGYGYWSAALSRQWAAWSLSVSYIGTDGTARRLFGPAAGQRVVASAVWSF